MGFTTCYVVGENSGYGVLSLGYVGIVNSVPIPDISSRAPLRLNQPQGERQKECISHARVLFYLANAPTKNKTQITWKGMSKVSMYLRETSQNKAPPARAGKLVSALQSAPNASFQVVTGFG